MQEIQLNNTLNDANLTEDKDRQYYGGAVAKPEIPKLKAILMDTRVIQIKPNRAFWESLDGVLLRILLSVYAFSPLMSALGRQDLGSCQKSSAA
jgi:hypothetical protein